MEADEQLIQLLMELEERCGLGSAMPCGDTLRAGGDVRRRCREGDVFYNPVTAFNLELEQSIRTNPETGARELIATSRLARMSDWEYGMVRASIKRLSCLWRGKTLGHETQRYVLLGSVVRRGSVARDYVLAEGYTHEPADVAIEMSSVPREREEPEREPAWNPVTVRVYNPLYGDAGGRDPELCERLSAMFWQYRASCSGEELFGRLLAEDDYGRASLELLRQLGELRCV